MKSTPSIIGKLTGSETGRVGRSLQHVTQGTPVQRPLTQFDALEPQRQRWVRLRQCGTLGHYSGTEGKNDTDQKRNVYEQEKLAFCVC